jgi:DNA-binding transcriptional ArsR family regulator
VATPAISTGDEPLTESEALDLVFGALSDPVRRDILTRLDGRDITVGELARAYAISSQAVWKHVQVLVRAGLVRQARQGRLSRCSLETGPIQQAAVWLNRYAKYWQQQFETMALWLDEIERGRRRTQSDEEDR